MNEYDEQKKRKSEVPALVHTLIALSAGLLLGFLGSLLLGDREGSGYVFLLCAPLLLGMIGMLTGARTRKKHPKRSGFSLGGFSWFGVWFSVLVWSTFQPQTITDCFHADPPCGPTTVPFWGEYANGFFFVYLFVYLVFLCWGLALVAVSGSISLDFVFWRRNRREKKGRAETLARETASEEV